MFFCVSSGENDGAKLQPILSQELFKEKIIPILANIFHVRDMQIRLVLLKFFPNYVGMFDQSQLEDVILPLVLLGKKNAKTFKSVYVNRCVCVLCRFVCIPS